MTEAAAGGGAAPPPMVRLRQARLGDVPSLVRLYRGQSAAARGFYHPFPFDRLRLVPIFLWMVATTPRVRFWLRHLPRRAAYVFVATSSEDDRPIGYGTIRFEVPVGEDPWAKFGYLVSEGRRGQGIGTLIASTQLRCARGLGLRRGGGYIVQGNTASAGVVEKFGHPLTETAPDRRAPRGAVNLVSVGPLEEMIAHSDQAAARPKPGTARLSAVDGHLRALGAVPGRA